MERIAMFTRLAPLVLVAALTVVGAGCTKRAVQSPPAGGEELQLNAWLPPTGTQETEAQRNLRELREALDRFRNTKSFRAKLSIETDEARTTGQINVTKPDRFHGTVMVEGEKKPVEVIGVGETIYVKMSEEVWIPVRSKTLSSALRTAFRASIEGDKDILNEALPDDTVVTKTPGSAKSCTRYAMTITQQEKEANVLVCIQNGLPEHIEVSAADEGMFRIEYFDYNALFTIERPTIPDEFRTPLPD